MSSDSGGGREPVGPAPEFVTLRLLKDALGTERGLMGAIYARDPVRSTYSVACAFGVEQSQVNEMRGELVFREGEERGFVGLVASNRQAIYLADVDATGFNATSSIYVGSAYMVPIACDDEVPAIIGVVSRQADGLSRELRAAIDSLAGFASSVFAMETKLRSRAREVERDIRSVGLGLAGLVGTLDSDPATEIRDRLRALSRREWEVVEALRAGKRVATIARELDISQNTVRNHLKSIGRKVGARSQNELREYLGSLPIGELG